MRYRQKYCFGFAVLVQRVHECRHRVRGPCHHQGGLVLSLVEQVREQSVLQVPQYPMHLCCQHMQEASPILAMREHKEQQIHQSDLLQLMFDHVQLWWRHECWVRCFDW